MLTSVLVLFTLVRFTYGFIDISQTGLEMRMTGYIHALPSI